MSSARAAFAMPDGLQTPSVAGLFLSFLRLGATSFGGPSMVAYIRGMAVEKKHWLQEDSFLAGAALCQAIPGATAMQTAAYVGMRTRGLIGAAASYTGFGLPAFLFMMVLSALYAQNHTLPAVVSVLRGLQAIVVAIVANATLTFGRAALKSPKAVAIALAAAAIFGFGINPIIAIFISALLGVLFGIQPFEPRQIPDSPKASLSRTAPLVLLAAAATGLLLLFYLRRSLFELAGLMSLVDLSAFGGGYAALPLMFHEIVDVRAWMDGQTFLNGIVLGQITPGPIVITATFVGNFKFGPWGGVIATLGVFFPSFLLVVATAPYFDRLLASLYFTRATGGILCSFVGLLLTVAARFAFNVQWNPFLALIGFGALFALLLKIDILWVVAAGTIVSIAWMLLT